MEYADRLRPELAGFIARLRRLGLSRIVLLSGDDQANATAVARAVGIDEALGDLLPEEKVAHVQRIMKEGARVVMVGDGTNDAPALSTATVGIALAAGGGGISAEAADAVILADDPSRVAEAITISRRTLRLARAEYLDWVGSEQRGNGAGEPRVHPSNRGSAAAGGDRRCGDPQRPPGGPRVSAVKNPPCVPQKLTVTHQAAGRISASTSLSVIRGVFWRKRLTASSSTHSK